MNKVFLLIFTITSVLGVPIADSSLLVKGKTAKFIFEMWSITALCFRTVFISVVCVINRLLLTSIALRISFILHCLCGYFITLISLIHRRKIVASVEKIKSMSSNFNPDSSMQRSSIRILPVVCVCQDFFTLIIGIHFFYFEAWEYYSERISLLVSFPVDSLFSFYFKRIVIFSIVITYYIGTIVTVDTILFLCKNAYRCSSQLIVLYKNSLKKDMKRESLNAAVISENIHLFKSMVLAIKELDKALNPVAFVIYVNSINDFFGILSLILSSNNTLHTFEALVAKILYILSASLQLFILTLSADRLMEEKKVLEQDLIELSNVAIVKSYDVSTLLMFSLLSDAIRSTKIHMTSLGIINITKQVIYSVAGAFVSYSVLMYQIGATLES